MMIWPIFAVGMLFNTMERGNASYDRVMRLINEKSQVIDQPDGVMTRPSGTLRFDITEFHYPDDTAIALHDVDFSLAAGKTLGIVGRVGAGKTTIMRLLLRQFERYQGTIQYGKTDILDYRLDAYLPAVGTCLRMAFYSQRQFGTILRLRNLMPHKLRLNKLLR